ncbi:MAG: MBL fold metallo-hydrolase [Candidatus Limnocylindrus sp.]
MADQKGLTLTALGTASAYRAHEEARASSYLVQGGGSAIVLDLGQGAYVPLARMLGRELLPKIDAVCVSHLHPDHWIDLIALRHALYHGSGMRDGSDHQSVRLFGPAGLDDRIAALLDVTPQWSVAMHGAEIDPPFNFTQWGEAITEEGAMRIESRAVRHAGDSVAMRVSRRDHEDAPGLVYSGDVAYWEDLVPLLRPGDTLLCEATLGDATWSPDAGHLSGATAGRAASAGGAARLLLTHLGAEVDPASAQADAATTFTGEIRVIREGEAISLS